VLLIEDDRRLAQLTARYFEQHGLRVTVRHDGLAGSGETGKPKPGTSTISGRCRYVSGKAG